MINKIEISSDQTFIESQEQSLELEDINELEHTKTNSHVVNGFLSIFISQENIALSDCRNLQASNLNDIFKKLMKTFKDFKMKISQEFNQINLSPNSTISSLERNSNGFKSQHMQSLSPQSSSRNVLLNSNQEPHYLACDMSEFKQPVNDRINIKKNRYSSSTSSTSIRQSSSTDCRYSTASNFTNSSNETKSETQEEITKILVEDTPERIDDDTINTTLYPEVVSATDNDEEYSKVYAKWNCDRYYYSGSIRDYQTHCEVYFDDNQTQSVRDHDIYQSELLPINTEVEISVNSDDGFSANYVVEEIIDIPKYRSKSVKGYLVKHQISLHSKKVKREDVRVHEDIMKVIKSRFEEDLLPGDTTLADISLDNIIKGKRLAKPKRFSNFFLMNTTKRCASPSLSNLPRSKRMKINNNKGVKMFNVTSKLFDKTLFILTTGECSDEQLASFDKIKELVLSNGGQIIEKINEKLLEDFKTGLINIIVGVIGVPKPTINYMIGLAIRYAAIVKVDWIKDSIDNNTQMPMTQHYLLNRGIDSSTGLSVELDLSLPRSRGLFYKKKVWIVTDLITDFGDGWHKILEASGADVYSFNLCRFSSNISQDTCDFVLAEREAITKRYLKLIEELNLFIVDEKYLFQCFIRDQVLDIKDYLINE